MDSTLIYHYILNSLINLKIGKFGLFFDTTSRVFNDHMTSFRRDRLTYQKVQPIIGRSKETMTSPASGVTLAEARCVRERGDLQREGEGLS